MKPKSYTYLAILAVIVVIILIVLAVMPKPSGDKQAMENCVQGGGTFTVSTETCTPATAPASGSTAGTSSAGTSTVRAVFTPATAANDITVDSPIVNATLHPSTPIQVSGMAKGTWFFEGSFPVALTDSKGKVISTGVVKSQGTWMTESPVKFLGSISYPQQLLGARGYVVLRKDNPSGLPQNDASVKIPVIFD